MMDRASERETRDLMSVESFSQLPFIRSTPPPPPPPPPLKDKGGAGAGAGAGGIRLFGQEFGNDDDYNNDDNVEEGESNKDDGSSSRKFECHYCCRNFPTSQALGGHQNAHKRERQQAKRAHLQSAMLHGGADPHAYALINYSRLGSSAPPPAYHSWSSSGAYSRIYSGYGAQPQPINGSPLAFWRVPAATAFDCPTPLLGFGNREEMMKTLPLPLPPPLMSSTSSSSASKAKMQERVSLDLHL